MASFGAKNPYFAPIESEPEGTLPVYKGEPVKIGRLVKADLTLTMASGKLYADDELAESAEEFVSGSIAMETDDILDTVASVIYGATVKEKTVVYNTSDNPPPGGLAYYKKLMRHGKLVFKGLFFPRVKAALGNDAAQTRRTASPSAPAPPPLPSPTPITGTGGLRRSLRRRTPLWRG